MSAFTIFYTPTSRGGKRHELTVQAEDLVAAFAVADEKIRAWFPRYRLVKIELIRQLQLPQTPDPVAEWSDAAGERAAWDAVERARGER